MSAPAIPAPGGAVSLPRFFVLMGGGAVGIKLYVDYVAVKVPRNIANFQVLGVPVEYGLMAGAAFILAAASSMAYSRISK